MMKVLTKSFRMTITQ